MAILKVWLDESEDECTSCGLCAEIAPNVFEVHEKMIVKENVKFNEYNKKIREAAVNCPTGVILF
jgi:ferredoxin